MVLDFVPNAPNRTYLALYSVLENDHFIINRRVFTTQIERYDTANVHETGRVVLKNQITVQYHLIICRSMGSSLKMTVFGQSEGFQRLK